MTTGRILPKLDPCTLSSADGFRLFREALGSALTAAQDGIDNAKPAVDTAIGALDVARDTVDKMLAQNPDSSSPNSLDALTDSLGGLKPTTEKDDLEGRVAALFDLNVVNGVLFPKGGADLGGLRRMFQSLEVTSVGNSCTLPDVDRDFIFVTAYTETIEHIVGEACGEPIIEFEVVDRKIGEGISIKAAMELSGLDEDQILIRFYWLGGVKKDRSIQLQLRALGLTGSTLASVIMAPKDTGNVFSTILDTTHLTQLRAKLNDDEICNMMNRPDTRSGLNLEPTGADVAKTVRSTLNTNTGTTQNKAGTSEKAITAQSRVSTTTTSTVATSGTGGSDQKAADNVTPAGRAGDPTMLLYSTVNFARSLNIEIGSTTDPAIPSAGIPASDLVTLDGEAIDLDDLPEGCTDIFNFIFESLSAMEAFATQGQQFISDIFGQIGLGLNQLNVGIGFSSCLMSVSLGLDVGLELALKLPFDTEAFLEAFDVALTMITSAIELAKSLLCIPQVLIDMLFGGVCGFKPFNFDACPPDLVALIDRLKIYISLVGGLISSLVSAMQIMKVDTHAAVRKSLELKAFSSCVESSAPLGIVLGLVGGIAGVAATAAEGGIESVAEGVTTELPSVT